MTHYILCALGLLLAGLIYSSSTVENRRANALLATLLILESLRVFVSMINFGYLGGEANLGSPLLLSRLLKGPLLFLYTCEVLGLRKHFSIRTLLHFIPFIIASAAMLLYTPSETRLGQPHQWWQQIKYGYDPELLYATVILIVTILSVTGYALISLRILNRYQHRLKHLYSSYEKVNLLWLKSLLLFQLLLVGLGIVYFLLPPFIAEFKNWPLDFNSFSTASTAILFFFVIFYGFRQPIFSESSLLIATPDKHELARSVKAREPKQASTSSENNEADNENKPRYQHSAMTKAEAQQFFDLLVKHVESQQSYLNPNLKIADLSELLGLSIQEVSQVINQIANRNFYEFINRYRIEYALSFAKQRTKVNKIVKPAEMAQQSGFNTSSTFYKHFKLYTGLTPKVFLKSLKERSHFSNN